MIQEVAREREEHEQLQAESRCRRDRTHRCMEVEAEGKGMEECGHPGDRVATDRGGEGEAGRVKTVSLTRTGASLKGTLPCSSWVGTLPTHGSLPVFQDMVTLVSAPPAAAPAAVHQEGRLNPRRSGACARCF